MKIYIQSFNVNYKSDLRFIDSTCYLSTDKFSSRDVEIEIRAIASGDMDMESYAALRRGGQIELVPVEKANNRKLDMRENAILREKYKVKDLINCKLSKLRLKDEKAFQDVRDIYLSESYFLDFIQEEGVPGKLSELYHSTLKFDKYQIFRKSNTKSPALIMKTQNGDPNIELDDDCSF